MLSPSEIMALPSGRITVPVSGETVDPVPSIKEDDVGSVSAVPSSSGSLGGSIMYGSDVADILKGWIEDWKNQVSSEGSSSSQVGPSFDEINDILSNLSKSDKDYMDTYLNWLMENYFVNSARSYDERMSNTSVSRMLADIKNAGYNPWLALQSNISSASNSGVNSGNVVSSTLSSKTSRKNNEDTNRRAGIASIVSSVGSLIGSFVKIIPWLLI